MQWKRLIAAGLAAGLLCHILQGTAAYLIIDRFYLENPDLIRDSSRIVGLYYMALNMVIGLVMAYLSLHLRLSLHDADWMAGIKAALLLWVASSPIYIIKRQIIFDLSNWLLLEIITDLIIYIIAGATAGFLVGRGIVEKTD